MARLAAAEAASGPASGPAVFAPGEEEEGLACRFSFLAEPEAWMDYDFGGLIWAWESWTGWMARGR